MLIESPLWNTTQISHLWDAVKRQTRQFFDLMNKIDVWDKWYTYSIKG